MFELLLIAFTFSFLIYLLLALLVSRRLAKWMKEHVGSTANVPSSMQKPEQHMHRTKSEQPVRPFAIHMLDVDSVITLSPETKERITRAHNRFADILLIGRKGVMLLFIGNIVLAIVGVTLGHGSPITSIEWIFLIFVTIAQLRNSSLNRKLVMLLFFWIIANFLWMFITLYALASYVLDILNGKSGWTTALLIALAIFMLALYFHNMKNDLINIQQSAFADSPLKMLFLFVFGSGDNINTLMQGLGAQWRLFGSMQLLKGTSYIDSKEMLPALMGRDRDLLATTPEEVMLRIKAFVTTPHWLGLYNINSILCNDDVWQLSFDILLDGVDVVCMDLCGFSSKNRGCTYELGGLINRLPSSRFVLLIDSTTDKQFLWQILRSAWESMAIDSPNRQPNATPIQIFQTQQAQIFNSPKAGPDESEVNYDLLYAETNRLFEILSEGAQTKISS